MGITRRSFLTQLTVGFAGLPLVRGLSWAQVKGKLGYMKIVDNAAMFVAMEKGFFKTEGLELETAPMAGGATNVKGKGESHAIEVLKTSPIKSAKDLEGKTVAVNTLNNIVHLMAMAWVDKNGASSSKVKFVEVPFPQMEAALVGGKIDAVSIHEPFATAALEKGQTRVLAYPWGDVLPKFLIASWFASEKWIAKNKEMGQAFVRAISRGVDSIHADPEGSRAAMVKWAGLNPDLAGKIGLPVFEKGISEKDLQATIDLTQKYKLISRPIKARDVISDLAPKG